MGETHQTCLGGGPLGILIRKPGQKPLTGFVALLTLVQFTQTIAPMKMAFGQRKRTAQKHVWELPTPSKLRTFLLCNSARKTHLFSLHTGFSYNAELYQRSITKYWLVIDAQKDDYPPLTRLSLAFQISYWFTLRTLWPPCAFTVKLPFGWQVSNSSRMTLNFTTNWV